MRPHAADIPPMRVLHWAISAGKLFWFPLVGLLLLYAMNTYETPLPRGFGRATGLVGQILLGSAMILYMAFTSGFVAAAKRNRMTPLMITTGLLVLAIPAAIWTTVPLFVAAGTMAVAQILAHRPFDDVRIAIAGWLKLIAGMLGIAFWPDVRPLLFLMLIPMTVLELRVLGTHIHRNTRRLRVKRRKDVQLVRDRAA